MRIREVREAAGVSLADGARQAGISYSYLSDVERGRRLPSLEVLDLIAVALGTTIIGLLKGTYPWDAVELIEAPMPPPDARRRLGSG
ncbi:helix-turn-helix domain-containing protein [Nocardioides piscis]|uniref:Helix-turn-helix transcriptional regulator n=1 Tax=Nocardioides piscis TaxID=2714938 RepID=A0A6G7YD83_9ACTN|nr:helix-turn-helix transcriptional regulator [Nocardioides piscis]QIK74753.1 helix-turn-helix transcriptional regulator [Nocardioides piscis]